MSLDFRKKINNKYDSAAVSINEDTHWKLISKLEIGEFPMLARIGDYYCGTVSYGSSQTKALIDELKLIFKKNIITDSVSHDTIINLLEYLEQADKENLSVDAISD